MANQLIAEDRIFADHYQFYIYDSQVDILDYLGKDDIPMVGAHIGEIPKGIHTFIMVTTVADLNDHWLKIYQSDNAPNLDGYDYSVCVKFRVESGTITINGLEPMMDANIPSGVYDMYVCARNLGVDPTDEQNEQSNDDFKQAQVESYEIYFVSKVQNNSNVIKLFS